MSERQWIEWQLYVKHFATPQRRGDINSALERQVGMAPYSKKLPSLFELIPRYGQPKQQRRTPAQVFELAQQAAIAARGGGQA